MEAEFKTWLVDRFREEEHAMLAEMQTQLLLRHKKLEQDLVAVLRHALVKSTVGVWLQEKPPPVDLDMITACPKHIGYDIEERWYTAPSTAEAEVRVDYHEEKANSDVVRDASSKIVQQNSEQERKHSDGSQIEIVPSLVRNHTLDTEDEILPSSCGDPIRQVFDSVRDGSVGAVAQFLEMRGDPNSSVEGYVMRNRIFLPCSMLAIAILKNDVPMVRTLIDGKAHPDSEYGFTAGSEGIQWRGPCATAAILRNNLEVVRLLLEAAANVDARGNTGASLIWECAYHGRADIASYLLKMKSSTDSIECNGQHPDSHQVSYTPLHVSILHGHTAVATQLLSAKADTRRQNELGMTPLDDAILGCHPNTVSLLVGEGAALDNEIEHNGKSSLRSSGIRFTRSIGVTTAVRPIDRAIVMENSVIIAAIAEGLARQEQQMRRLKIRDIVMFLETIGDAPANILNAMFVHRRVSYLVEASEKESRKRIHRKNITTAFIEKPDLLFERINVSVMNMSYQDLASKIQAKCPLDQHDLQQITKLAPQERSASPFSKDMLMSSVDLYECLVTNVHRDLGVIKAIADLEDRALILKPCQAILKQCWHTVNRQSIFEVLVHAALLFDFIVLGVLLQRDRIKQEGKSENHQKLRVVAGIGLAFSAIQFLQELFQCIAFYMQGWLTRYLSEFGNYIDWVRLAGDNIILLLIFTHGSEVGGSISRIALSFLAFYKWIKLMYALTKFRVFGQSILPILEALRGSGPFIVVLSLCSFGLWHAYIALQPAGMKYFQSWILIYRLAIFGELGDTDLSSTEESYAVQIFYMIAAFMITVTLMNVYIAALSNSFNRATERTVTLFERNRAHAVLSSMAVVEGIRLMSPCRRRASTAPENEVLWFCCAAHDVTR